MSSGDLKFYYFKLRARGELTRLILAAADRKFDNISFSFEEWPEYKPKMILGQCPVLELSDGTQIPQSLAIARYVAQETGIAGANALEAAKIDAVVETQRDINEIFYAKVALEKDEAKKAEETKKFLEETVPKHIESLQKLKDAYSSKDSCYFVGDKLSWADLYVFQSVDTLLKVVDGIEAKAGEYFQPLFEAIKNHEKLKEYLSSRPDAPF